MTCPLLTVSAEVLTSKVMLPPAVRAVVPLPLTKLMSLLVLFNVSAVVPLTDVVRLCTALSALAKEALPAAERSTA
ncbi:hypothetical protein EGK75_12745 [Neisseria weixii]|uniref:Uncharacterized protein n=1 Tax=Neisseria weixii TaxID=1853276 RepID=A0A3N4MI44_9NEIS|nr:hypothetical protein EGK74_12685 [Neisseria weixii]RPD83754.1 hypothetical protein EGK75_12745 [Neisseria weixii]